MTLVLLKQRVREIGRRYGREDRAKRLFVEERAASLSSEREREFSIRKEISEYFGIRYQAVSFCGSGQLGFSIRKDTLFEPGVSDLDAACIDTMLYQKAWIDVMDTTRAMTEYTSFSGKSNDDIQCLKDQIMRRGMIRVDLMPKSNLSTLWSQFQSKISRKHTAIFAKISIAIYMNEYAFCMKQDTSLSQILGG